MKIENQVCSLEQAKQLKRLGVCQDSVFVHDEIPFEPGTSVIRLRETATHGYSGKTAAFTVAELGVMLPDYKPELGNLEIGKCETDHITMKPHKKGWWNLSYWIYTVQTTRSGDNVLEKVNNHLHQKDTAAEAMATMVIYLLESKLITSEEVNKRLQSA